MKILVLSTWNPFPPDNGSKIRNYSLLSALAKAHQITLVTFDPAQSKMNSANVFGNGFTVHSINANPFRYNQLPMGAKFLSPVPMAYWPLRSMSAAVEKVIAQTHWDVVIAMGMHVGQYALCAKRIPRLLDVENLYCVQLYDQYKSASTLLNQMRKKVSWLKARQFECRLLLKFQLGTVVSQLEKDFLCSMILKKDQRIEVIPNGVNCLHNHFSHRAFHTSNNYRLVYNGALTYRANYDAICYFLKEVFPLIRAEVNETTLTITGSTNGVDLARLPLDEHVFLSGYVEDIRPVVADATVCVVPLRQGGGTRLKILEAMALGTPVVSTTKGAEGLEVLPDKHLLIGDHPEQFAQHAVTLLRDPSTRAYLARNARGLVEEKYDWLAIGRRFVSLVEEVAGRQV